MCVYASVCMCVCMKEWGQRKRDRERVYVKWGYVEVLVLFRARKKLFASFIKNKMKFKSDVTTLLAKTYFLELFWCTNTWQISVAEKCTEELIQILSMNFGERRTKPILVKKTSKNITSVKRRWRNENVAKVKVFMGLNFSVICQIISQLNTS